MLVCVIAVVLFLPNGWLPIWLAGGATLLLSFDRRLGPLPAALFVMLALPVGRGAEVGLPRIAGDVPVRAHDFVPMVGVALALPAILRRLRHPAQIQWMALLPIAVFGAVGLVALAMGVLGDQATRDVIRDARWWAFYAIGALVIIAGTARSSVMRAVIWGLTLYSLILIIGLLMPAFNGGLKWYAYSYDPRMRLHYGQAVFLLLAVGYVAARTAQRPSAARFALLALLSAGVAVTLTRALLAGAIGIAAFAAVWATLAYIRPESRHSLAAVVSMLSRRALPVVAAVAIGIGGGFGAYWAGIQIWEPTFGAAGGGSSPSPTAARPVLPALNRIFEDSDSTGLAAQVGGRVASYGVAFVDTAEKPLFGHGLGELAQVPWAWGGFHAYTRGSEPGVDNAYLTIGLKAGAIGIAAFTAMVLWPLRLVTGPNGRRMRAWFVPAWLGILGLTMIQSFAVSGYAPFALSLLLVLPVLGLPRRRSPAG